LQKIDKPRFELQDNRQQVRVTCRNGKRTCELDWSGSQQGALRSPKRRRIYWPPNRMLTSLYKALIKEMRRKHC